MKIILETVFSAKILTSVLILAGIIVCCAMIKRFKDKYRKNHENEKKGQVTAVPVVFGALRFFVVVLGVLYIFQINGLNVSGMVAGIGIASAILGLALQDLLKDIIMGINILADHFYSMGECVEFEGREGVIVGLTLRSTKIGDLDDHSITTVCNRNISQIRRLGERLDIDVPLPYGEDVELVNKTLAGICKSAEKIENLTKCTYEGTQSFESSSIHYRLRVFCEPKYRADIRRAVNREIQNGLKDAGISIPFNQLDVHCDMLKKD